MHNPKNRKSFLHHRMKIFKICMNQGIKKYTVQKAKKVDDADWKLAIEHLKPDQSEFPSIQSTVFAKQTMTECKGNFSSPPPLPPLFSRIILCLGIIFDSP